MLMVRPSADAILQYLQSEGTKYYDEVVPGHQVSPIVFDPPSRTMSFGLGSEGSSAGPTATVVKPTPSAETQYLAKIDVNAGFFHKCSQHLKQMVLAEFHQASKSYMFRCYHENDQRYARAVLGPSYPTDCDDRHLYPIALSALEAQENITILLFSKTDHITELLVQYNDVNVEFNGSTVRGTVSISNSETGHSAIWIEPTIQIYNNVYLGNNRGDGTSRYIHRGELPTIAELTDAVRKAKQVAQVGVIQYLEEAQGFVTPKQVSGYLNDLVVLPRRFCKIIEEEIKDAERVQKGELIRKILLAASQLPLIQQLQVRREVGKYVGVFENTASRIAAIANQLQE